MIGNINKKLISLEQRKRILNRCIKTQPFFNLLSYEIITSATKDTEYQAIEQTNKDFIVTELRSNFGELFTTTGSLFDISLYTLGDSQSFFGYASSLPLPVGWQANEGRNVLTYPQQIFNDRQIEINPRLIKRNDTIISETRNVSAKLNDVTAELALCGFFRDEHFYIKNNVQRAINDSLEKPTYFDYFSVDVDFDGTEDRFIKNDRFPRLVLGFGIVNESQTKGEISEATILISDTSRSSRWTNKALPIEFLAPRLTSLRDTHLYYLPVEYFLEPFASLNFTIKNDKPTENANFKLLMLTRTV